MIINRYSRPGEERQWPHSKRREATVWYVSQWKFHRCRELEELEFFFFFPLVYLWALSVTGPSNIGWSRVPQDLVSERRAFKVKRGTGEEGESIVGKVDEKVIIIHNTRWNDNPDLTSKLFELEACHTPYCRELLYNDRPPEYRYNRVWHMYGRLDSRSSSRWSYPAVLGQR